MVVVRVQKKWICLCFFFFRGVFFSLPLQKSKSVRLCVFSATAQRAQPPNAAAAAAASAAAGAPF